MRFDRSKAGLATLLVALALSAGALAQSREPPELKTCLDENLDNEPRIAACGKVVANKTASIDFRVEALITRGLLWDDEEEYDKAIADYTEALKLAPNDHATLVLRGNSHDANGSPQLAIADYTAAIKLAPDDAAAYYNRATVYEELGERDKAIADYTKALEIEPDYTDAKEALDQLRRQR